MQNDVLKNRIVPWQEKGRWYHGVWDYATASFITDKTDQYILDISNGMASVSASIAIRIQNKKIRCLSSVCLVDSDVVGSGSLCNINNFSLTNTGYCYPVVGPSSSTGTVEFWVFLVELE